MEATRQCKHQVSALKSPGHTVLCYFVPYTLDSTRIGASHSHEAEDVWLWGERLVSELDPGSSCALQELPTSEAHELLCESGCSYESEPDSTDS